MARSIRIQYPGATYHVISRGIEKRIIFNSEEDYLLFKKIYRGILERYNWECYAYCLMPNHYHLLLRTLDPNLSVGMCQLNGDYSQKYNIKHSRVGHLFQGRYKSILVEEEKYKNRLIRYITLNPLRAKFVNSLEEWRWSSYLELMATTSPKGRLINRDQALNQFGNNYQEARKNYIKYLYEKHDDEKYLENRVVLGSDLFLEQVKKYFDEQLDIADIPKKERYAFRPELLEIFKHIDILNKGERDNLIYQAHIAYGYNLSEIGRVINMHQTTIGRIISSMF